MAASSYLNQDGLYSPAEMGCAGCGVSALCRRRRHGWEPSGQQVSLPVDLGDLIVGQQKMRQAAGGQQYGQQAGDQAG